MGQDSWDGTAEKRQPGQDIRDSIARTRQVRQNSRDRTANRTAGTRHLDRTNGIRPPGYRTARTRQ